MRNNFLENLFRKIFHYQKIFSKNEKQNFDRHETGFSFMGGGGNGGPGI